MKKETERILKKEDLIQILREIIRLNIAQEDADDVDHLGNRRVRAIGELVQSRFRIGLARMERIVKDRMSTQDVATLTPAKLINARPVIGAVREFFMSSQLSQFMDQTNPLSELEHKRRLSAMGPGGLTRERAGFDVRDVHRTHYGRICPIESPEGPNIGLVGHLASYARINDFGFIETPYRKVKAWAANDGKNAVGDTLRADIRGGEGSIIAEKGTKVTKEIAKELKEKVAFDKVPVEPYVTSEIVYLNAFTEERGTTAPATTPIDPKTGKFLVGRAAARKHGEPTTVDVSEIEYVDVSSKQLLAIAAALIPFVENDDGHRALMGSNMQRQAVPCIKPDAPIVGTGVERRAGVDSGHVILASDDGTVQSVDGRHIEIKTSAGDIRRYELVKFQRSNHSTCINQRPAVKKGQEIYAGEVLIDGTSCDRGELALGQNLLVRLPFLGRVQLRRRDHPLRTARPYGPVYFDPHRKLHDRRPRHEARTRSRHVRHPERLGRETEEPRRPGDHPHRRGSRRPATSSSGRSPRRAKRISPRKRSSSARSSARRPATSATPRSTFEHGEHGKRRGHQNRSAAKRATNSSRASLSSTVVAVADLRKVQVGDKLAGRHGNKGVISKIVPRRGHAVPRGRHAGRHHPLAARRRFPYEHRTDARDAPWPCGERARVHGRVAGLRRRSGSHDPRGTREGRFPRRREDRRDRRPHRRSRTTTSRPSATSTC